MAVPPENQTDINMLEVEVPNTRATTPTNGHHRQALPFSTSTINGHAPIMISMAQEEYTSRQSRESVLQRLSEALLRRSLTKVRRSCFLHRTIKFQVFNWRRMFARIDFEQYHSLVSIIYPRSLTYTLAFALYS